jgi:hypothetical protein
MVRRLILINLLLLLVAVAGVVKLRRAAIAFSTEHRVDKIQPESEKPLPKAAEALVTASPKEWTEIASRNPFSFDRNDVPVVAVAPAVEQPKRPKPVLFGTMMLGKERIALMSPSGNRVSVPLKVGETLDEWTIVDIQDKSVTVKWQDVKESVIMNDPTAQVAREYSKTGATTTNQSNITAVAPFASAPAPAPSVQSPANATPPPSPSGRKQIVIQTPFGPKIMDDPAQQ